MKIYPINQAYVTKYDNTTSQLTATDVQDAIDELSQEKADSSNLATVATSGSYNDLSNKPTIPAAQVNSDWNAASGVAQILNKPNLAAVATSGSYNDLNGAPTLAPVATSGDYDDLTDKPDLSVLQYLANIAAADDFNPGTSYSYLDFVKYNDRLYICKSSSGSTAGPFDPTEWNEIIIGEQAAEAQRTFLLATQNGNRLDNLATVATSGNYNDLNGTPAIPAAQVNSDWNAAGTVAEILNKPNLSAVATSGLYADLVGAPSLAPVATSGDYDDLNNKPTIPTKTSELTNDSGFIDDVSDKLDKVDGRGSGTLSIRASGSNTGAAVTSVVESGGTGWSRVGAGRNGGMGASYPSIFLHNDPNYRKLAVSNGTTEIDLLTINNNNVVTLPTQFGG